MMSSRKYKIDYILSNMIECKMEGYNHMDEIVIDDMAYIPKSSYHRDVTNFRQMKIARKSLLDKIEEAELTIKMLNRQILANRIISQRKQTREYKRLMLEELRKNRSRYDWI